MEYVDGTSLSQLLSRTGRLGFEGSAQILVQVLDALTEAHAKGLVHRELKPSNVLLQAVPGYRDFARVLDFGLARWVSGDESRLTRTGAVAGTPRYPSPEQIRGDEVTLQTDLYAAGVLLYEALAGSTPFEGDLDAALMVQHLSPVAPRLPDDVERIGQLRGILDEPRYAPERLPSARRSSRWWRGSRTIRRLARRTSPRAQSSSTAPPCRSTASGSSRARLPRGRDVALEQGDAEAARAHADALEAATRDEPFAWAERVIARGRGG